MFTDLAIILVNWNLKNDTIECIESLLNSGAAHRQIIIVDNGSMDGSAAAINERYHNSIMIIKLDENLGYAAGVNIGIKYALSHDYNWILLLNNDTIVADDFIDSMYSGSQRVANCAIFSPVIFYRDNPAIIWSMGEKFINHTLLTLPDNKNRTLDENLPEFIPIDVTNGCAMMVSREVFERIGLFDSKLFMYGEEVDFCWRARQAAYNFACLSRAHIWHKISLSSQKVKPRARYLQIRNQVIFYKRYATSTQRPFYGIFTLFRIVGMTIADVINGTAGLIKPSILGWLDGWFREMRDIDY
jgi:GT2 family glycosyltransferase